MINGVHALIYTKMADEVRSFIRNVLEWPTVDAGHGWLLFTMPPGEMGVHPTETDEPTRTELYLMCDDIRATVAELKGKGVEFSRPIADQGWGLMTGIKLPDGSELGLYQPRHPTALPLQASTANPIALPRAELDAKVE